MSCPTLLVGPYYVAPLQDSRIPGKFQILVEMQDFRSCYSSAYLTRRKLELAFRNFKRF
jgi:hypothetical protein